MVTRTDGLPFKYTHPHTENRRDVALPVLLLLLLFLFCLLVCLFFVVILVFVGFVASDVLTTICHLAIVNYVCVIIILSIGNTQISILLLCFLYLLVELMITINE